MNTEVFRAGSGAVAAFWTGSIATALICGTLVSFFVWKSAWTQAAIVATVYLSYLIFVTFGSFGRTRLVVVTSSGINVSPFLGRSIRAEWADVQRARALSESGWRSGADVLELETREGRTIRVYPTVGGFDRLIEDVKRRIEVDDQRDSRRKS